MSRIDRGENKRRKLTRIGHLRCGEVVTKKTSKGEVKEYPTSLDYFKATGDYSKFFHDVYGDKPSRVPIVFISDNTDDSCDERMEIRKGKKLYAYGDGRVFQVYDEKSDSYIEKSIEDHPTLVEDMEKFCDEKFEDVLTLRFIILGVKSVFGFWQLTTKGAKSSILQLVDTFDMVQEMAGTVRNIPFDLVVEKVVSQKPESKASYPVITLIPNVCKENLDKLGELIQTGAKVSGLLTEQKISEMNPLSAEDQVKDTFQGTVVEAEREEHLSESGWRDDFLDDLEEQGKENFKKAIKLLQESKTFKELNDAVEKVKKIKLSDDEKEKATIVWREMVDNLKNKGGK